jgi:hypothetical protein
MHPRRMLEHLEAVMASVEKEAAILAGERPHLIVLRGPKLGDFFTLEGDALDLGSDPFRADVVVRDIEVEPRHAKIFRDAGGEYVLRDLGTGKGTIVNDEALDSERALSDGDRITLSNSVLEFSQGDPVRAAFHDICQCFTTLFGSCFTLL